MSGIPSTKSVGVPEEELSLTLMKQNIKRTKNQQTHKTKEYQQCAFRWPLVHEVPNGLNLWTMSKIDYNYINICIYLFVFKKCLRIQLLKIHDLTISEKLDNLSLKKFLCISTVQSYITSSRFLMTQDEHSRFLSCKWIYDVADVFSSTPY